MNGFFKLTENGIQRANAIYSQEYSLTSNNKQDTHDGWHWFESAEEAVVYFARQTALTGSPIEMGEQYVINAGFDADRKVTLLDMLLQAKENNILSSKQKLVAIYTWLQTVKAMAIAGQVNFPPPPYTFEEVVSE